MTLPRARSPAPTLIADADARDAQPVRGGELQQPPRQLAFRARFQRGLIREDLRQRRAPGAREAILLYTPLLLGRKARHAHVVAGLAVAAWIAQVHDVDGVVVRSFSRARQVFCRG